MEPVHLFESGGGGSRKSHLLRKIHQVVTKTFMYNGGDPDKPRVTCTHWCSSCEYWWHYYLLWLRHKLQGTVLPINDKQKASLQNKLSEVMLLITDEISIVLQTLFYQINFRLIEIFGVNKPFGGLSVVVCDDFY